MTRNILILFFSILISPLSWGQDVLVDFFTVPTSGIGSMDGRIDLRIIEGQSPFLFYWSSGAQTENIEDLMAGNYLCTVVDNAQNPYKVFVEIMNPGEFNWEYDNTGENHTIFTPTSSFIGINPDSADYFGVFFQRNDSFICGGYSQYDGASNLAISAWGDNSFSAEKDGFDPGERFQYAFFDVSEGKHYFLQSNFQTNGFPNFDTYITNGMSGVQDLGNITGELTVSTPFASNFQIYPNPGKDVYHLSFGEGNNFTTKKIQVYSLNGSLLLEDETSSREYSIQLNFASKGVYLILVDGKVAGKIIHQP